jgi:hypothetical protein
MTAATIAGRIREVLRTVGRQAMEARQVGTPAGPVPEPGSAALAALADSLSGVPLRGGGAD